MEGKGMNDGLLELIITHIRAGETIDFSVKDLSQLTPEECEILWRFANQYRGRPVC